MTNFTHSLSILIGINANGGGIPRLTTAVNDAARLVQGQFVVLDAHSWQTFHPSKSCNPDIFGIPTVRLLP